MTDYPMEELMPIVAKLTDKYTSKESSSITYEKARQLMGAVIYCIQEGVNDAVEHNLPARDHILAMDAYQTGYQKVIDKVSQSRICYNELLEDFYSYGNENYQTTVIDAISGFFVHYDALFFPQHTIITMDYPTILPIEKQKGIDAVSLYIEYIAYEQKFLSHLPQDYVNHVLFSYQNDYQDQFYNICRIVARNLLACMITGRNQESLDLNAIQKIEAYVQNKDEHQLEKSLRNLLESLILHQYAGDKGLFQYLQADLKDFCFELRNGVSHKCLNHVFKISEVR